VGLVDDVAEAVDAVAAESGFAGVVRVDRDGETFARAYGLAHRPTGTPHAVDTRLAIASGSKAFTALVVASVIEDGGLGLDTTARSLLGDDLPLVDDSVTVAQLLEHRSGIGDYLDEDEDLDLDDYLLTEPPHRLVGTEDYLGVLGGHPQKFTPGSAFSYCNGGYVLLALLAERGAGVPFHDLVAERVFGPAGMHDTAYLRSDELPAGAATGYLDADGLRTNVFHLPVRGSGDGGAYTTAADVHAFWPALLGGKIVPPAVVAELVRPRNDLPETTMSYGRGFWIDTASGAVRIEGMDAGVSFRSAHLAESGVTHTVLANTTDGAWPVSRVLRERFG
jgi:CubicO group peptidase (beta-lactamase class C family)